MSVNLERGYRLQSRLVSAIMATLESSCLGEGICEASQPPPTASTSWTLAVICCDSKIYEGLPIGQIGGLSDDHVKVAVNPQFVSMRGQS